MVYPNLIYSLAGKYRSLVVKLFPCSNLRFKSIQVCIISVHVSSPKDQSWGKVGCATPGRS